VAELAQRAGLLLAPALALVTQREALEAGMRQLKESLRLAAPPKELPLQDALALSNAAAHHVCEAMGVAAANVLLLDEDCGEIYMPSPDGPIHRAKARVRQAASARFDTFHTRYV
jgi:hypothetical protein